MWWWKPWESAFLHLPPGAVCVELPGPHEENLRLQNAFQHRSSRIVGQQQMKTPSTPGLIEDLHFFFFTAWGFWGKFLTHQRIVQLTGKQLASACWDGVARIYDLEKEEEPVELRGHTGSPDVFWELLCWIHPWKWTTGTQEFKGLVQMVFSFAKQSDFLVPAVHFPGCTKKIKKAGLTLRKVDYFLYLSIWNSFQ